MELATIVAFFPTVGMALAEEDFIVLVFILSALIFVILLDFLVVFLTFVTITWLGNCKGAGPRRSVVIDALVVVLVISTKQA